MPVVVFASPKGGVGKSTSALILATELSTRGASVTLIDADPNQPLYRWSKRSTQSQLTVIANVTEDTIIDSISDSSRRSSFVIVDLEGTASVIVGYAMSRADLVLIPSQGSQLDAFEAVKAIKLVNRQAKAFSRYIPCAILFTRTSAAMETRDLKDIQFQFQEANVRVLKTQMVERAAFRAIFTYAGALSSLESYQVSNIAAAKSNALAFVSEVVELLKSDQAKVA